MTKVKIKTMYEQASKIGEGETSKHTNCCSTSLTKSTVKGLTVLGASERQKVDDIFYENHSVLAWLFFELKPLHSSSTRYNQWQMGPLVSPSFVEPRLEYSQFV